MYGIHRWGEGYFDVNAEGNVVVKPNPYKGGVDLYKLVQSLVERGIEAPILLRFNGIIRDRIETLHSAFQSAIQEFGYRNAYHMAFPIKVNPQRHVVETVQKAGENVFMGLEVGSKPELIAVMTLENQSQSFLLCNGYKDVEYISLALMASKLGWRTLIIIEQMYELKIVLEESLKLGVEAQIGFRMKLSTKGSGRWISSGGEHSKFGLFSYEITDCLKQLEDHKKSSWLKLLHFHIGSQITSIESIKKALKEASRMYTELVTKYPSLAFFDVGGGLAVDYDGTKRVSDSSMNYTLEEYARDVVSAIGEACLEADVPDPVIISESGRATVSHHSILITEIIDVAIRFHEMDRFEPPSDHDILNTLTSLNEELMLENSRETLHDLIEIKDRILEEFVHGKLKLEERAYAEKLFGHILQKIRTLYQQQQETPEEIKVIDKILLENYFCNFSVFQSLPDSWAIGHLFPIMPIHRLQEIPTHQTILADLSCDSDGKIDTFIGTREPKSYIELHSYLGKPYYIGIFLVGAYQEILGGLHNLFGDTNAVHVEVDENGGWNLLGLVEGDTIEEVLAYVQYSPEKMMEQLQSLLERSLKKGKLTLAESAQIKKKYRQSLESYTYLVV
jgi:arginine decarboxylase